VSDKKEISEYLCRRSISTRWMDNDVYGHINNVNYYSFFDSAVNGFLIEKSVLDIENGETIGLVVETGCKYFAPLSFPDEIEAGIFVSHIGNSSVRYEIGLFKKGEAAPAAQGFFVHVYVDRASRRPTSIPEKMKSVLKAIERTV
jgi:acyl-CoA thioester hydrolase